MDLVSTKSAPGAVGPYSQAVRVPAAAGATWVFTSGQVGLDPATGTLVPGGLTAETAQVLRLFLGIANREELLPIH